MVLCSMSPQERFYAHIVQSGGGGGEANLCFSGFRNGLNSYHQRQVPGDPSVYRITKRSFTLGMVSVL